MESGQNHIAEDYKGALEDLHNNLGVAADDLSHAEELYEKNSNRGEQSGRLKQLLSLISQAEELTAELISEV
jgi:hypothetical protein